MKQKLAVWLQVGSWRQTESKASRGTILAADALRSSFHNIAQMHCKYIPI
jgi:hypothetical protein